MLKNGFGFMSKTKSISFIIPVYNRPDEIKELLKSFLVLKKNGWHYEIIIADDGSNPRLEGTVNAFKRNLPVEYFYKPNSGPGDTRNQAMKKAKGDYLVILDSDVVLPDDYMLKLQDFIEANPGIDMFGGPDTDLPSFDFFQKAVNLSMTSFLTTGGIRGKKQNLQRYVPRSFNMVLKREVFDRTGGFGNMHPGEDPEWVYRAWRKGFRTGFAPELKVYHKRRIDWKSFSRQITKFGITRCILNRLYPEAKSVVYWAPVLLVGFALLSIVSTFRFGIVALLPFGLYLLAVYLEFLWNVRRLVLALAALGVFAVQTWSYAKGFLTACIKFLFSAKPPDELFPELFFKTDEA